MEHITNMNKATLEMIEVIARNVSEDITKVSTDEFQMMKSLIVLMEAYNGLFEEMYMMLDHIEDMMERK